MKWFITNAKIACAVFFAMFAYTTTLCAQEIEIAKETKDTVVIVTDTIKPNGEKNYRSGWGILLPEYGKLQYAGNMGFLSLGGGWDYGKNKHWETDVFVGFLPHFSTSKNKITFTVKQNYIPWRIHTNGRIMVEPIYGGLYLNSIWGRDFWVSEPEKYPSSYYAFSSKIRVNVFAGQRITYNFDTQRDYLTAVSFFYEVSTYDLNLLNAIGNKYLTPKDYLTLSLGIKVQIF